MTYTYTRRVATALLLNVWFSERLKNVNTTVGLLYNTKEWVHFHRGISYGKSPFQCQNANRLRTKIVGLRYQSNQVEVAWKSQIYIRFSEFFTFRLYQSFLHVTTSQVYLLLTAAQIARK